MTTLSEICSLYAVLTAYPGTGFDTAVEALERELPKRCPPAAESFAGFSRFVRDNARTRLEEVYTGTFDLQPLCTPYVGYQLCGDGYQRSRFLVKLQEIYRRCGFRTGSELPDHYAEVLRFLAAAPPDEDSRVLAFEGLLPALERSLEGFDEANPYRHLLHSLRLCLAEASAGFAGGVCAKEAAR